MRSIDTSPWLMLISFQVVDTPGADRARRDYPGGIPGAVRPLLRWTTQFEPAPAAAEFATVSS